MSKQVKETTLEYLLFSYPNCAKCDALKEGLNNSDIEGTEYNLIRKESKLKLREYLKVIKRDDKGGIIIPTLILRDEDGIEPVLNSKEELQDWLRSKD